ncbi:hypothetical protein SORBI_3002G117850 [Sorghum bicolor]|uniref:Uncharacterized protein n=1 Tax=Sorghum bicolor TaxID=4558 RepID=A0A1W0W3F4_SORBI|nr:hypothetical protein SORBI_3002G117850 [Sorghum bicolor]OQU88896.1 hypothetical protein SORBI_3002G117850 [Sorghum bicolor]
MGMSCLLVHSFGQPRRILHRLLHFALCLSRTLVLNSEHHWSSFSIPVDLFPPHRLLSFSFPLPTRRLLKLRAPATRSCADSGPQSTPRRRFVPSRHAFVLVVFLHDSVGARIKIQGCILSNVNEHVQKFQKFNSFK